MTYQNEFTLSEALLDQQFLEQLTTDGFDALPTLFQVLLNAAMQIERQNHLGAAPHQHTEDRTGYATGFKDKTLTSRLGQITVAIPQVREVNGQGGGLYLQSLERGTRSVRAIKLALSEHEVHWRTFLQSLVSSGLCGVRLVTSVAHEGLKAARLAVFGGVCWQRCQFLIPPNKALAECFGVCAQAGHERAGGSRHPRHLQRTGQSRGR